MNLNITGVANMKIGGRLGVGFSIIVFILILAVGTTAIGISMIQSNVERIVQLRVPTADSSRSLAGSMHASLAALRGWIITGKEGFKSERNVVWGDIDKTSKRLDKIIRKLDKSQKC